MAKVDDLLERRWSSWRSSRDWLIGLPAANLAVEGITDRPNRESQTASLTQTFDIALASFRKLDDLLGDHFISEVARALNSRTSRFEGDAHERSGLRIEVRAV